MSQKLDNLSDSEIEQILGDDAFAFCRNAERIPRPYSHRDFDKSGTSFIPDLPDSEFERNLEDLSCGFVRTHNEVIELERERMKENAHETAESVRVAKYNEQALKKRKKTDRKHLTPEQKSGVMFMLWGSIIIAIGIISYVEHKKTQRVEEKVKAYEKTLPAEYLEYKQAVEHYRDSLMRAKGR